MESLEILSKKGKLNLQAAPNVVAVSSAKPQAKESLST
jgi:hypothetical protein